MVQVCADIPVTNERLDFSRLLGKTAEWTTDAPRDTVRLLLEGKVLADVRGP